MPAALQHLAYTFRVRSAGRSCRAACEDQKNQGNSQPARLGGDLSVGHVLRKRRKVSKLLEVLSAHIHSYMASWSKTTLPSVL